jgi:hypothetical protein
VTMRAKCYQIPRSGCTTKPRVAQRTLGRSSRNDPYPEGVAHCMRHGRCDYTIEGLHNTFGVKGLSLGLLCDEAYRVLPAQANELRKGPRKNNWGKCHASKLCILFCAGPNRHGLSRGSSRRGAEIAEEEKHSGLLHRISRLATVAQRAMRRPLTTASSQQLCVLCVSA